MNAADCRDVDDVDDVDADAGAAAAAAAADRDSDDCSDIDAADSAADVGLFKAVGLYRLLRPRDAFGRRYRAYSVAALRVAAAFQAVQLLGLYYAVGDLQRFNNMAVLVACGLLCTYKGYAMAAGADAVWRTLDVAGSAFAATGGRGRADRLRRCGGTLRSLLRPFVVLSYVTLVIWTVSPLLMDATVPLTGPDGVVAEYRMTINNLWVPVSAATYNSTPVWLTVYAIETFLITVNVFSWVLFDCYMITMCFVLNAQFDATASACETLGVGKKDGETESDHYDNLILHIKDNQKIIKKLDDFFDIVRPVVLAQITSGSFSVIILIYLTLLMYLQGWSVTSLPILKFSTGLVSLVIELYIYCYSFNYIEMKKSTVSFGLYSSNWTGMNLKYKKTLLLAMKMNAAHQKVMKITPKSIVNLEMFSKVMNMSYSVVSLLLNSDVSQVQGTE